MPQSQQSQQATATWQKVAHELIIASYNIRMFHWSTDEYHAHKVSGKLYKRMNEMIDSITELLIGRESVTKKKVHSNASLNFTVQPPPDRISMVNYLTKIADDIESKESMISKALSSDHAVISVRDELLKELRVSAYLMKMK